MHILSSITCVFLPTLNIHALISTLFKCCKNLYVFLLLIIYVSHKVKHFVIVFFLVFGLEEANKDGFYFKK